MLASEAITYMPQTQLDQLAPRFVHLASLALGIEVQDKLPERKLWNCAFPKFLAICTNVSELSLTILNNLDDMAGDDHGSALVDMHEWPTFPNLKSLLLGESRCDAGDLLAFLTKHKASLRKLTMVDVAISWQDDWRMLLEGTGEQLDLDQADIRFVEDRHGSILMVEAKRPHIRAAVEQRTRHGIFCPKCASRS
jgi:hypothetical protein